MGMSKKTSHHKSFWIGLVIVVCFGYIFGKDLALKHNAQDESAQNILEESR